VDVTGAQVASLSVASLCDTESLFDCYTLQHTATHYNTLQYTTTHCNTLQHTATHYNTLQHITPRYNTLQHTATHCNTLQHTATHCNTLQHMWGSGWWRRLERESPLYLTLKAFSTARNYDTLNYDTLNPKLRHTATHTATHCNTLQHAT